MNRLFNNTNTIMAFASSDHSDPELAPELIINANNVVYH